MQAPGEGGREQAAAAPAAAAAGGQQSFHQAAAPNSLQQLRHSADGAAEGLGSGRAALGWPRGPPAPTHLTICPTTSPPFDMAAQPPPHAPAPPGAQFYSGTALPLGGLLPAGCPILEGRSGCRCRGNGGRGGMTDSAGRRLLPPAAAGQQCCAAGWALHASDPIRPGIRQTASNKSPPQAGRNCSSTRLRLPLCTSDAADAAAHVRSLTVPRPVSTVCADHAEQSKARHRETCKDWKLCKEAARAVHHWLLQADRRVAAGLHGIAGLPNRLLCGGTATARAGRPLSHHLQPRQERLEVVQRQRQGGCAPQLEAAQAGHRTEHGLHAAPCQSHLWVVAQIECSQGGSLCQAGRQAAQAVAGQGQRLQLCAAQMAKEGVWWQPGSVASKKEGAPGREQACTVAGRLLMPFMCSRPAQCIRIRTSTASSSQPHPPGPQSKGSSPGRTLPAPECPAAS